MIKLLGALAIVVAFALIAYDGYNDEPAQASDTKIETGWTDLDSLLEDNLPDGTQSAIAGTLDDSAGMIRGLGNSVVMEFKDAAQEK